MYTAQMTISRVQSEIKRKGYTQKLVLIECGLSENALKQMKDKQGMASFNLAQIADYLDCSVDYFLGRTDNPDAHKLQANSTISQSNVNNDNSIVDVNPAIPESDGLMQEFMNAFKELSFDKKIKAMDYVNKLK